VRILPYALAAAMAAPILVWILVNTMMVKGTSTVMDGNDTVVMITLGICTFTAFGLLAVWLDKAIQKTRR
jgi:hypothetical protein